MRKPLPDDTWNNLYYPPANYAYFEGSDRVGFEPGARDFSWRNAWWLAEASLLAYVQDRTWGEIKAILVRAGFEDAKQIGPDPAKSTKGFLAWRSGPAPFAIVAFRGTDKGDPRTLKTDMDLEPEARDGYTAHRGFLKALDLVWDSEVAPALAAFLRLHPGAPVYFTGHSLGAALADDFRDPIPRPDRRPLHHRLAARWRRSVCQSGAPKNAAGLPVRELPGYRHADPV